MKSGSPSCAIYTRVSTDQGLDSAIGPRETEQQHYPEKTGIRLRLVP